MERVIFLSLFISLFLFGEDDLQKNCLNCHQQEQIPSYMIYKRYLLKYSVKEKIEDAIYNYLKDPKRENSIMPKPFFLKFPMKEPLGLDDETLKKSVKMYVEKFDVRKRLKLGKKE